MPDTKTWWQSRTIWLQLVAVLFLLLGRAGVLPKDLDQDNVVDVVMAIVGIVTIVLRIYQTHAIAKPSASEARDAGSKILAIGFSIALPLAMLGSLSACVTTGSAATAAARAERIERISNGYAAARAIAELFLPLLPADQAARVRLAGALVERALTAARSASTTAQREAALREAEAAAANFSLVAGA